MVGLRAVVDGVMGFPGPEAAALPTGVVTFLLTDIASPPRGEGAHGAGDAPAVSHHDDVLDEAVRRRGGVRPEQQGEGDSRIAAFARASDAIAAAIGAQLAHAQERQLGPWPLLGPACRFPLPYPPLLPAVRKLRKSGRRSINWSRSTPRWWQATVMLAPSARHD